jgi:Secretion system C-terminal sorting domain
MRLTKKLAITALLGLIAILPQLAFAQAGFTINYHDESPVEIQLEELAVIEFEIINTAAENDSIIFLFLDDQFTVPEEWTVTFCAGSSCYPSFVRGITVPIGGFATMLASIDISPGTTEGVGSVFMQLTSFNDPTQTEIVEYLVFTPGITSTPENREQLPETFSIQSVYPNPFNAQAAVSFTLPQSAPVEMQIFSIDGRMISTEMMGTMSAGMNKIMLNMPIHASSGTYLISLKALNQSMMTKAIFLK